jgi:hypothetical protein
VDHIDAPEAGRHQSGDGAKALRSTSSRAMQAGISVARRCSGAAFPARRSGRGSSHTLGEVDIRGTGVLGNARRAARSGSSTTTSVSAEEARRA